MRRGPCGAAPGAIGVRAWARRRNGRKRCGDRRRWRSAHHRRRLRAAAPPALRGRWCRSRSIWLQQRGGIRRRSGGRPRMRRGSHLCLWSCRGRRAGGTAFLVPFGGATPAGAFLSRRGAAGAAFGATGGRCGGRRRGNRWLGAPRWCGNWLRGRVRCRRLGGSGWRGQPGAAGGAGCGRRGAEGEAAVGGGGGRRGRRRAAGVVAGAAGRLQVVAGCGALRLEGPGRAGGCLRCFLRLWLSVGTKLFFGLCHNQRRVLRMRGMLANCIAVRAVVASSTRRSFVMMVWVPGKLLGRFGRWRGLEGESIGRMGRQQIGDQRISVRPDCGGLQRRSVFISEDTKS